MTYSTQAIPTFSPPVQQLLADSIALTVEGVATAQAQGKKLLESALELGAASAKDGLKYAEELRAHVTDATSALNERVRAQVVLWSELPKDPVAATQKVIAASVEGSRRALEVGAEALTGYVRLVNDLWARVERASQETREQSFAVMDKLQAIVGSAARKS